MDVFGSQNVVLSDAGDENLPFLLFLSSFWGRSLANFIMKLIDVFMTWNLEKCPKNYNFRRK